MNAVGNDAAQLEEVPRSLCWQKETERADLLVQVRLRPTCVDCGPLATVRHVMHAELPLPGCHILGQGQHQDLLVLTIRHDSTCGVPRAADANLVAPVARIGEQVLKCHIIFRHDPWSTSVHVVGPCPKGSPRHGLERRSRSRIHELAIPESRALEARVVAPAASAGLIQRCVGKLVEVSAVHLVGTHAHLVVPNSAVVYPVTVAIVVCDHLD
mmetsp:Transcript_109386/g.282797  ORF Transcript_109386/g.282797 Transcript_109386/m.282797 type:complete len:213 (-) Transcript_109386:131-769(-)